MTCDADNSKTQPLVMYHDGACPLCRAEVILLKNRSRYGEIEFADVSDADFDSASLGASREHALRVIHGRVGNAAPIRGVDVFVEAYSRTDLRFLSWLLNRKWLRPILNVGYHIFAANRQVISRLLGPPLLALMKRRYRHADHIAGERQ